MSEQIVEAVFENGAFHPVDPGRVTIAEGQRVRLLVDDQTTPAALESAFEVYRGLSADEIDEIERIALDRSRFFSRRDSA